MTRLRAGAGGGRWVRARWLLFCGQACPQPSLVPCALLLSPPHPLRAALPTRLTLPLPTLLSLTPPPAPPPAPVAAGVPQRMLLDYLAEYRHCRQASGWTLPAFTWWTDQTIGGAVATGSHGSSMKYGSLSSQVGSCVGGLGWGGGWSAGAGAGAGGGAGKQGS